MKFRFFILFLLLCIVLTGCGKKETFVYTNNFDEGPGPMSSGLIGVPKGSLASDYALTFRYENTPDIYKESHMAVFLSMDNITENAFQYLSSHITTSDGLEANTEYDVVMTFDLITNMGEAGKNVYLKAGIVNGQVVEDYEADIKVFNLDKGNGREGGSDLKLLGTIEAKDPGKHEIKKQKYQTTLKTDEGARLSYLIGVDSTYKGVSSFYINNIEIKFYKK